MSLILDALKQADSERGRGAPPGVFNQPPHDPGGPAPTRTARRPLGWLLAAAAGATLLGYLAWPHAPWAARLATAPTPAEPALASTAPPAEPVSPAESVAPPGGALFNKPAPEAKAPVAPAATQPPGPLPASSSELRTAPPAAVAMPPLPPYSQPVPPALPVPNATDLSADARAQLPSVQITGHTYSDNPTLRMLMIDGHMVVEGQAISSGLRLERIGPHQAVFNHRGTRFSVDY